MEPQVKEGNPTGRVSGVHPDLMIEVELYIEDEGIRKNVGTRWRYPSPLEVKALNATTVTLKVSREDVEAMSKPVPSLGYVASKAELDKMMAPVAERSGGFVNYYLVHIANPQREEQPPYTAECEDLIRALDMNFDEGNVLKALWRSTAARALGKLKAGGDAVYDAEKMAHSSKAILRERKFKQAAKAKPTYELKDKIGDADAN